MKVIILELIKKVKFNFQAFLSIALLFYIGAYFWRLSFYELPQTALNNVSEIKMVLVATLTAIVGFWLGTSISSKKKDDAITNLSAKP